MLMPVPVKVTVVAVPGVIGVVSLVAVIVGATSLASPMPRPLSRVALVPPGLLTVTLWSPITAVLETVNGTVIEVELLTTGVPTVTPVPETVTVAPVWKFVPRIVVVSVVVVAGIGNAEGLRFVIGAPTIVITPALVTVPPSSLVTVMLYRPGVAALPVTLFVGTWFRLKVVPTVTPLIVVMVPPTVATAGVNVVPLTALVNVTTGGLLVGVVVPL
jgi:hypothetical protein